ncbi:MAG TPA: alpha/beta fold hydrolase [Candidatus Binataceae bacterium]|nr:alpha/beta fold hydrolase [Candidatus Binataceae bacterium]
MNASEFHSTRKFTDTPFGRIAYVERGAGPGALFIHGLPLCGFQWREVLDDLSGMRRCIALDLMGLGYNEIRAGQDISFESQARMIAAFLDAQDIKQVDLTGNDTGGGVSQIFAARNPERVRTLTLTDCEVNDLWPNAMLQQFYGALKSGIVGETFKVMARDESVARAQLGTVFEDTSRLVAETLDVYFGPFVESAERLELVRGFADAEGIAISWSRSHRGCANQSFPRRLHGVKPIPPLMVRPR